MSNQISDLQRLSVARRTKKALFNGLKMRSISLSKTTLYIWSFFVTYSLFMDLLRKILCKFFRAKKWCQEESKGASLSYLGMRRSREINFHQTNAHYQRWRIQWQVPNDQEKRHCQKHPWRHQCSGFKHDFYRGRRILQRFQIRWRVSSAPIFDRGG